MTQYVIARKEGEREYYLENIYGNNKVVWITSKKAAMHFQSEMYLKQFIEREFPGKGYYIEIWVRKDDWKSDIIIRPQGIV